MKNREICVDSSFRGNPFLKVLEGLPSRECPIKKFQNRYFMNILYI